MWKNIKTYKLKSHEFECVCVCRSFCVGLISTQLTDNLHLRRPKPKNMSRSLHHRDMWEAECGQTLGGSGLAEGERSLETAELPKSFVCNMNPLSSAEERRAAGETLSRHLIPQVERSETLDTRRETHKHTSCTLTAQTHEAQRVSESDRWRFLHPSNPKDQ